MESTEQADGAETPAPSRPKRSRAGCLTCRTRRRKCDEGKPKCQNCILKGFECRYAAAFQILGKNNFTPEVPSSVKYTNLTFVSEGSGNAGSTPNVAIEEAPGSAQSTDLAVVSESSEEIELARDGDRSLLPEEIQRIDPELEKQGSLVEGPNSGVVQEDVSPLGERYEFALHGLLALGSGSIADSGLDFSSATVLAETEPTPTADPHRNTLGLVHDTSGSLEGTESNQEPQTMQDWTMAELSDEHVLNLLKHYRYGIAPWMDICDLDQCFGCEILQVSAGSPSIRYAVLALAEASFNSHRFPQDTTLAFLAQIQHQQNTDQEQVLSGLLTALGMTRSAVLDLSGFWTQERGSVFGSGALKTLLPHVSSKSLATSVFWLVVRLEMSVALVNSSAIRIPLPSASISATGLVTRDHADQVFQYATEAVSLCADAISFCNGEDEGWLQQRYGLNRVDLWKTLVAGFDHWYNHRPPDFQPVIELYPRDGRRSEDEYPTIIFSSGATTLANQLYHTGMLLLLQNKPRFVDRPQFHSSTMSLLWQTHRICGIGVNNDRVDCWDPSLVASLLVAARSATHRSQHTVILNTLENVQRLTGWNISRHVEELQHEWQQAQGW